MKKCFTTLFLLSSLIPYACYAQVSSVFVQPSSVPSGFIQQAYLTINVHNDSSMNGVVFYYGDGTYDTDSSQTPPSNTSDGVETYVLSSANFYTGFDARQPFTVVILNDTNYSSCEGLDLNDCLASGDVLSSQTLQMTTSDEHCEYGYQSVAETNDSYPVVQYSDCYTMSLSPVSSGVSTTAPLYTTGNGPNYGDWVLMMGWILFCVAFIPMTALIYILDVKSPKFFKIRK